MSSVNGSNLFAFVCDVLRIAFFYYCKLASFFQPVMMKNSSYYVQHTLAKMLEYKTPTVALFYIFSPGHASRKHYRHDNENYRSNFRDEYIERSLDTKKFIEMILNHIKENDPNALLFIFGDHGPTPLLLGKCRTKGWFDLRCDKWRRFDVARRLRQPNCSATSTLILPLTHVCVGVCTQALLSSE